MIKRKALFLLFVFFSSLWIFSGCASLSPQDSSNNIRWRTLAEGMIEAQQTKKPCLVDFYTGEECHRCRVLDRNVYLAPKIIERINRDFIPVRVSLDGELTQKEQALADELKSGGECILLFLDHSGKVIKDRAKKEAVCTMDMLTPEVFIEYMDRALKNING
ncbi:MAG: thioredoxin family protein [Proteobacteria bacterium]|nr:thioredoxin family protein [Pseudomonadota bacterium]MBU1710787.1 thioredoxin family protein [Pseudomonadota bacterium]